MVYISLLTDVQNVRFMGQRIQQRFLRGGNRFRGERRFQKSHGERKPTSRIFVHFQRLELNGGTYFRISALVSNRFAIIFSSFFFFPDSILTMYDMCRYEKAWTVTQLSPWCAVFSKEELHVLEYREDLYYYYKAGYGREINARLGCTLLQDMMNHFW